MFTFKPLQQTHALDRIKACIASELLLSGKDRPQLHIGNLIFDQYICCDTVETFQSLFYEIYHEEQLIGFLAIEDEGFGIYLKTFWETARKELMQLVENNYYSKGKKVVTTENLSMPENIAVLRDLGYSEETYYRYNGICNILPQTELPVMPADYSIRRAQSSDAGNITKLIGYATQANVTVERYLTMQQDPEFRRVDEWIVTDRNNSAVAYATFWKDTASRTAVLEPVACMETHRKMGLTKALLFHGLQQLWQGGIETAYVSTSGTNVASQALYSSVGFKNFGFEYEFGKQL